MGVAKQRSWSRYTRDKTTGLKHGFRSGLEEMNAKHLEAHGVPVLFEQVKVEYAIPMAIHTYTPDFPLPNGILVETKGKFEPKDRAKHLFIKVCHPELDIRFVFQKPHAPIAKGSRTTHAQWADKYGFKWAAKTIPEAWWGEPARLPASGWGGGPATIRVPQATLDYLADCSRQPQRAGRNAATRIAPVAGKGAGAS